MSSFYKKLFSNKMVAITSLMVIFLLPILVGLWWYMGQL